MTPGCGEVSSLFRNGLITANRQKIEKLLVSALNATRNTEPAFLVHLADNRLYGKLGYWKNKLQFLFSELWFLFHQYLMAQELWEKGSAARPARALSALRPRRQPFAQFTAYIQPCTERLFGGYGISEISRAVRRGFSASTESP